MSFAREVTLYCPRCGASFPGRIFPRFNSDCEEELAEKLISGSFFDAVCPLCGHPVHLEYDLTYHDQVHGEVVCIVHKERPDYAQRVEELRTMSTLLPIKGRIVHDLEEFREKVACIERGRDDCVIALYKYFVRRDHNERHPERPWQRAFYFTADGKELLFLHSGGREGVWYDFQPEAYEQLKAAYERSGITEPKHLAVVDEVWAEKVCPQLRGRPEEEKQKEL